ncbi:hypothetical protein MIMGU_mgv1a0152911mg, partial [Erythranthe guttata]
SAIKLQEIGPRMTLHLIKIEEGLCAGPVIFSEFGNYLLFCLIVNHSVHIPCFGKLTYTVGSGVSNTDQKTEEEQLEEEDDGEEEGDEEEEDDEEEE